MNVFVEELLGQAALDLLFYVDRGYTDVPNQVRNAAIAVAAEVRANRLLRAHGIEPESARWRRPVISC